MYLYGILFYFAVPFWLYILDRRRHNINVFIIIVLFLEHPLDGVGDIPLFICLYLFVSSFYLFVYYLFIYLLFLSRIWSLNMVRFEIKPCENPFWVVVGFWVFINRFFSELKRDGAANLSSLFVYCYLFVYCLFVLQMSESEEERSKRRSKKKKRSRSPTPSDSSYESDLSSKRSISKKHKKKTKKSKRRRSVSRRTQEGAVWGEPRKDQRDENVFWIVRLKLFTNKLIALPQYHNLITVNWNANL